MAAGRHWCRIKASALQLVVLKAEETPPRCVTSLTKARSSVSDPDRPGTPTPGPPPLRFQLHVFKESSKRCVVDFKTTFKLNQVNNTAVMVVGVTGAPPGGCKQTCKTTDPKSKLWAFPGYVTRTTAQNPQLKAGDENTFWAPPSAKWCTIQSWHLLPP